MNLLTLVSDPAVITTAITTVATGIAGALASVTTLLVARWKPPVSRTILALGIGAIYSVLAVGYLALTGSLDASQTALVVLGVIGSSQALYAGIVKQLTDASSVTLTAVDQATGRTVAVDSSTILAPLSTPDTSPDTTADTPV